MDIGLLRRIPFNTNGPIKVKMLTRTPIHNLICKTDSRVEFI